MKVRKNAAKKSKRMSVIDRMAKARQALARKRATPGYGMEVRTRQAPTARDLGATDFAALLDKAVERVLADRLGQAGIKKAAPEKAAWTKTLDVPLTGQDAHLVAKSGADVAQLVQKVQFRIGKQDIDVLLIGDVALHDAEISGATEQTLNEAIAEHLNLDDGQLVDIATI